MIIVFLLPRVVSNSLLLSLCEILLRYIVHEQSENKVAGRRVASKTAIPQVLSPVPREQCL